MQIRRFAPNVDAEFARHLSADTDPAWMAYCRRTGPGPIGVEVQVLEQPLRIEDLAQFLERRDVLERAALRVGEAFSRDYDFHVIERWVRHDMSLSPVGDFKAHEEAKRYIEINSDARLTPEERIRIIDSLTTRFSAEGDTDYAIDASLQAIPNELERGRPDCARARLESALRASRQARDYYVTCQLLGQMGVMHAEAGHPDSMRTCFDEGIAIARSHGLIDHATRLLKFYSTYYANQGRLATSLDRLVEAQRLCRAPGGENALLPLQVAYTKAVAGWGCWDLVDRSLLRLTPMLREASRIHTPAEVSKFTFDTGVLRARLSFATGVASEGARLMQESARAVPVVDRRVGYAELLDQWSEGLAESNRAQEALVICERGLAHCDSTHVPEVALPLLLRKAQLLDQVGQTDHAAEVLAQARRALFGENHERLQLVADILEARLLFHEGRVEVARRFIERVFRAYRQRLRRREDGVLSDLELQDARSLREAIHEIEGFTPEAGYRFELEWRDLARRREAARPAAAVTASDPPASRSWAVRSLDGTHLVYWFGRDRLLRWTARARGVVVDTLPLTSEQCLLDVRQALELLQNETPASGEVMSARTLGRLRQLAGALLPRSLNASSGGVTRVYISPDGPLASLPFEALPVVGPRGEQPLAMWADVAYVSGRINPSKRSPGREVIVSNPELPPDLVERYGWADSLTGSEAEAQAAVARWPDAILLAGEHATKESIRATWPGASVIYLATHHVRDPDAPFLGFVPLAAPAGSPPDAALLEIADVHALDLSACRLAVLASCSSGAPYRFGTHPGPSLSDAFLDSGAAAVIRSFWDVGDQETREFMRTFLAGWRDDDEVAASLARARREFLAAHPTTPPRVWAAWSVEIGRP